MTISWLSKIHSRYKIDASKPLGKLYLFLSPEKLHLAVKNNRMTPLGSSQPMDIKKKYLNYKNDRGETVFWGVSTTRNQNWKPNETSSHKYWADVRLTLDGNKISQKYKVKSYNDFWKSDDYAKKKRDSTDEFYAQSEEKIITDKNGIKDWMQYLLAVDVLEDARDEFERLKLDFKKVPVNFVKNFSKRETTASILYYHGTTKELEIGRLKNTGRKWIAFDKKEINEPFWLTTSLSFARLHGPNTYVCNLHLPSEKIFGHKPYLKDNIPLYKDAAINDGRLVYDALEKHELFADADNFEKVFAAIISEDYDVIETKEFINWATSKGFAAAYVQGDGPRNLMVFNPEHIEIVSKK